MPGKMMKKPMYGHGKNQNEKICYGQIYRNG